MESRHVVPADRSGVTATNDLDEGEALRRLRRHAPLSRAAETDTGAARRRGDDDLNPGFLDRMAAFRPAAVLVPMVRRPEALHVLFTRRTPHLNAHAGQICFPGGRVEAHDGGPRETALRETAEEIGLAGDGVKLTGQLDPYHTRTGFAVTPFVGMLDPPSALHPDPAEVAEVFEVPLAFLLHPDNCETHTVTVRGTARRYHVFVYGSYYIWGATAGMLVNLAEVLRRPC